MMYSSHAIRFASAHRVERGKFIWPSPADGVVVITPAQLAYKSTLFPECDDNHGRYRSIGRKDRRAPKGSFPP
jgi:hypothetical protein